MTNWFQCKVTHDKTLENGLIKKATDTYLVDAQSFTEAESRFMEEIEPFMSGDFEVADIKKAKIAELFESEDLNDDRWFRAKVAFITIDEKKEVEKRTRQNMLIQAKDLRVALANLDKHMKGTLADWTIESITETPIIDVFKYAPKDEPVADNN